MTNFRAWVIFLLCSKPHFLSQSIHTILIICKLFNMIETTISISKPHFLSQSIHTISITYKLFNIIKITTWIICKLFKLIEIAVSITCKLFNMIETIVSIFSKSQKKKRRGCFDHIIIISSFHN